MSEEYTEKGFWEKLDNHAKKAGSEVVEKALQLYYAADSPTTPTRAKTMIYGALVYLIAPLDLIPDFIPVGGSQTPWAFWPGHWPLLLPTSRQK